MKTTIKVLLGVAIAALTYFCIMSIITPIQYVKEKESRDKEVIQRLIDLRDAQIEYKSQKGAYTTGIDTLITFLKNNKKKVVVKEGVLTDKQLEAGLTETKASAIVRRGNKKEILDNGLTGFRRDTTFKNLITALYGERYTLETIDEIQYIPYSDKVLFEISNNNGYMSSNSIPIPLCEIRAPYKTYLMDINKQETLNAIDLQKKLMKYPGLKVGSIEEPNNFAGNWE
jgi:hypothetical protein